jgi:hypothetical protein
MQSNLKIEKYTNIPFPNRKYIPGRGTHPKKDPHGFHTPELPSDMTKIDNDNWHISQRYLYALDLFNFGYWWEAHEVLEDLWIKAGKSTLTAKFIQGLIQISAAFLKDSQLVQRRTSPLAAKGLSKLRLRSGIFLGLNVEEFGDKVERYFTGEYSSQPQIILWDLKDK